MLNTYDETFVLRPRDCDLNEKWRPSAILETMQDAGMGCIGRRNVTHIRKGDGSGSGA